MTAENEGRCKHCGKTIYLEPWVMTGNGVDIWLHDRGTERCAVVETVATPTEARS